MGPKIKVSSVSEDHIVRVEDLWYLISFFFLFLRLAELEDLVETVQDLIACPLIVDKATDIHVLQGRMRQPAHPIPTFFFLSGIIGMMVRSW